MPASSRPQFRVPTSVPLGEESVPEARRRRRRLRRATATVAVLLVVATTDFGLRIWEFDRLLRAMEVADNISQFDSLFAEASRCFDAPQNPNLDSDLPGGQAISSWITANAQELHSQILRSQARVDAVFVLPWHRSLRIAQTRVLDHTTEWMNYLSDVAVAWNAVAGSNLQQLQEVAVSALGAEVTANPRINGTFYAAEEAIAKADPATWWFERRRGALFEKTPPASQPFRPHRFACP